MESVSKNTIFGLKMMVKSGLEKFILKSLHAGRKMVIFVTEFVILGKNMGEICGLKFPISYVDTPQKILKSLQAEKRSFFVHTEFVILGKTSSFYEVNEWVRT